MFSRIVRHLLPTGRAWRLFPGSLLAKFVDGLVAFSADVREFVDLVWLDTQPQDTRELEKWETIFGLNPLGLTEQQRRDAVEGAWRATGGQSPQYIQDVLHAAGFTTVYIHEWWVPGTTPPVPRDPSGVSSFITAQDGAAVMQDGGDAAQDGGLFGGTPDQGYFLVNKLSSEGGQVSAPSDPAQFRYILYFGGEVFGEAADVPAGRRRELETLLLRVKPAQQWLGLLIDYT